MENKKTIEYLNSKAWYRLLKVIFGFFVLASVLIFNGALIDSGAKRLDNNKTLIYCTYKDKRVLTPKQVGIELSGYQFTDGFNYQKFFESYNEYQIKAIFKDCYDKDIEDVFAAQRFYELNLQEKKSLTLEEVKKVQAVENASVFDKSKYLDYSIKLFDIKPVYTYAGFIKLFLIGNLAILLFFEVLRQVFYYVVLGEIRPNLYHTILRSIKPKK